MLGWRPLPPAAIEIGKEKVGRSDPGVGLGVERAAGLRRALRGAPLLE